MSTVPGTDLAQVRAIFEELSELPPGQRAARLAAVDRAIREQVEPLLASHDAAGEFLSTPAALMETVTGSDEGPFQPFTLGGYLVTGVLGVGGMGAVYRAEQTNPRRTVALKVIRAGWNTPALRRRFAHEAEALGRLRHPGIAQIFEAGSAQGPDGRETPFFAMELVNGEPITKFVAAHALGTRDTLALVALVCDAAHHAHQKGIVHRDLKPANILVEESEGTTHPGATAGTRAEHTTSHSPAPFQPKILDFGIARLTDVGGDSRPAATTMHTDPGALVGTLAYMSPEQVRGQSEQIDTRSDVYALGVILFELLTGELPYAVAGKSIPDAARLIAEDEPTLPGSVEKSLRGDLETIILKAIAKEPERRYQSAAELAADLRRFLGDLPIVARPATTTYQLRKFARRHRALVAGVCAAFVALVLGMAGTTWAMFRALDAEALATSREQTAAAEARKAGKSVEFLVNMLTSADPDKTAGREVTVREVLDRSAANVGKELENDPEVRLAVEHAIGRTYRAIGDPEKAMGFLESALSIASRVDGERSPRYAAVMNDMAKVRVDQRQWDQIIQLAGKTLEVLEAQPSPDPLAISRVHAMIGGAEVAMNNIPQGEKSARRAYEIAIAAHGEEEAAQAAGLLAEIMQRVGGKTASAEAEKFLREQVALLVKISGDLNSATLLAKENLGWFLANERRPKEGLPYLEEARTGFGTLYGPQHRATLNTLTLLARCYQDTDQLDKAEELATQAVQGLRVAAPDAPELSLALTRLGRCRYLRKDFAASEESYRDALRIHRLTKDPRIVVSMSGLGGALENQGKFDEALELQREAIAQRRAASNPGSDFGTLLNNHGALLSKMKRFEEAEGAFKECIAYDAKVRPGNPLNGLNLRVYASFLINQNRPAEAVPLAREASDLMKSQSPSDRRNCGLVLLKALEAAGMTAEADALRPEVDALAPPAQPAAPAAK